MFRISAFAFTVAISFGSAGCSRENTAIKPVPRDAEWMGRHQTFVDRAKKGDVDVLFIGDSITHGWEWDGKDVWEQQFAPWKPMNLGIAGDGTEHVLWRITEGNELDGIDPKVIVLLIGTNNSFQNSPEQITAGVGAILAECRTKKPNAKILLLGLFPRARMKEKDLADPNVASAKEQHKKIPVINALLAKFDDGKTVKYLDIGPVFLNESGGIPKSVMTDFLHLGKEGYERWARAIKEPVEALLKN